jgi:hypothetical protein
MKEITCGKSQTHEPLPFLSEMACIRPSSIGALCQPLSGTKHILLGDSQSFSQRWILLLLHKWESRGTSHAQIPSFARTSLGHGVALVDVLVGPCHSIGTAAVGLGLVFNLRTAPHIMQIGAGFIEANWSQHASEKRGFLMA